MSEHVGEDTLKSGPGNSASVAEPELPAEMGRLVGNAQTRLKQIAAETKDGKVSNNPQERALEVLKFASALVTDNPPVRKFLEESKGATHHKDSSGSTYFPESPYSGIVLAESMRIIKYDKTIVDKINNVIDNLNIGSKPTNVGIDRAIALSDGTVVYGAFRFDPKENPNRRFGFFSKIAVMLITEQT